MTRRPSPETQLTVLLALFPGATVREVLDAAGRTHFSIQARPGAATEALADAAQQVGAAVAHSTPVQ